MDIYMKLEYTWDKYNFYKLNLYLLKESRMVNMYQKNKSIFFINFLIFINIVFFISCDISQENDVFLTKEEKEWLELNEGEIKIGYTIDYPPVEFLKNDEYVGMTADYFKLLEKNWISK